MQSTVVVVFKRILERLRQRARRPPDRVTFDEVGVTRVMPSGEREFVGWDALQTVAILTTDEGPLVDDVFWLLIGQEGRGGCLVPSEAEGMSELLPRLQSLPGFDNLAVVQAMGSCENATFECWRRKKA